METEKRLQISALNIVTHPHSTNGYIQLLKFCRKKRIVGIVNKARHGYLGSLSQVSNASALMHGRVFFYKSINVHEPWLDIEQEDEADDSDLDLIKEEAKHLKPEFKRMQFVFDAKKHKLYFERFNEKGDSFSPLTVNRLFDSMLNHDELLGRFGDVDVTTVPQEDALRKIFRIPSLRKLTISLTRPNPDDLHDHEQAVMDKLYNQNLSREQRILTKARGAETIEPDDDTKILAEIAKNNGYVQGDGRDNAGQAVKESTKEHPKEESEYYTEPSQSRLGAFINYVKGKR